MKPIVKSAAPKPTVSTAPAVTAQGPVLIKPKVPPVAHRQAVNPPAGLVGLNVKQQLKRRSKAADASLKMRAHLWPDLKPSELWDRHTKSGFTTVPRTMPMLVNIINDLSKAVTDGKSSPAGKAYLVLWCRAWDEAMVKIDSEPVAAAEAGYTGERSVSTWRLHLKILKDLGFIDFKEVGSIQYVLIFNPYKVVKSRQKDIQEGTYAALYGRALEIGAAEDFDD
jgi:hypothetical protein